MEMFCQKSWELRLFRCWKLADPNCYFFFITVPVACKTTTKFILFKASATSERKCAKKFLSLDDNSPIFLQHCRLFHHPPEDFKEKKKTKINPLRHFPPILVNIPLFIVRVLYDYLFQARFMKLMNEKASLIERIQELEHVTIQLSHETETIGEYLL